MTCCKLNVMTILLIAPSSKNLLTETPQRTLINFITIMQMLQLSKTVLDAVMSLVSTAHATTLDKFQGGIIKEKISTEHINCLNQVILIILVHAITLSPKRVQVHV